MTANLSLPLGSAGFTKLDLLLSAKVTELGLPPRATNAFKNAGINFVGQLVQQRPAHFLVMDNFGRTSLQKTQEVLSLIGLDFGTDVQDWTTERAEQIRDQHLKSVRARLAFAFGIFEPTYSSATSELNAILDSLLEGRNREIAGKFWGLFGEKPRTLESVGQEYGVTRERVRQITTRAGKAAKSLWLPTANCEKLINLIERQAPMPLEAAQALLDQEESCGRLPVESLLNVADIFKLPSRIELAKEGSAEFVDKRGRAPTVHEIAVDFRRATSRSGTISVDRTSLRLTGDLEERGVIKRVLSGLPETVWLDEERSWAASANSERNRLGNTLRKILTVTETIHVSEMRQAALRSHRLTFVPPQSVLSSFAEKVCKFSVAEGMVSRGARFEPVELGENEQVIFDGFRELGSPLPREKLEAYCIDQRGMNDNSFYVYLSYSPIVARIATGIYGRVGAPVPVGTIEQLSVDRKKDARSENGWDKQGRLWFATRLNRISIKMGMFYLPAFVIKLTTGEWSARLPDGTKSGIIDVGDQGIMGLKPILELSGAEPEDVMILRFDFTNKSVEIEVGDDELFDGATETPDGAELASIEDDEFDEDD